MDMDFFNHEIHEMARKKFMGTTMNDKQSARLHEFFSCHFVYFVVKRYQGKS